MVLYQKFGKRALDLVFALLLILLLSPLLLLLTLVGAVAMGGSPFFGQLRPGRDARLFKMLKFRTMRETRDATGQLLPNAARLTAYGRFLRVTSLDELPQLFNILVGQMSFVGPRPLLPEFLPYYTAEERRRHAVRPGLTGPAQIGGRNRLPWEARFALDVAYADRVRLCTDLKILIFTVWRVLCRNGVVADPSTVEEDFVAARKRMKR